MDLASHSFDRGAAASRQRGTGIAVSVAAVTFGNEAIFVKKI
jgi:hypothetical protein